jgi:signal transduction histidine kinase
MFGTVKSVDRTTLLVLALAAIAILLPTGALLWFVSQGARQQIQVAQERTNVAYESQLRILQPTIDNEWRNLLLRTERAAGDASPANYPATLSASLANTVLLFNDRGALRYPTLSASGGGTAPPETEPWLTAETLERRHDQTAAIAAYTKLARSAPDARWVARAAEGLIRCLARSGQKQEALAAIEKYFRGGAASRVNDSDGRWVAGDEQLLGLSLMDPGNLRSAAAQRLKEMLEDYSQYSIPSAQRIFLGDELRAIAPASVPTTDGAERLALQVLEKGEHKPGARGQLLPGSIHDLWEVATPNGRVLAVYRTDTLSGILQGMLKNQNVPNVVEFYAVKPGAEPQSGYTQVLAGLPGWRIAYTFRDSPAPAAAVVPAHRIVSYLWVAYLIIACAVLAGIALVQTIRRQMRLARLRTDLATTVSHELKTPLASTRLLVESLLEDADLPPATSREYLQMIAGENLRLTRLVENFLTFSRMERKRQRFEFTEVQPAALVEAAVASVRERVQSKPCRLDMEVDGDLPPLHADRDAMITVLLNLLDNAVKYTPVDRHIHVRAFREGDRVVFSVEDNGIGVAPRDQKRIFRRFYQVDQRLARENGGCGLGLSIVDYIVRAHGGVVAVRSSLGHGSTFRVLLPCTPLPQEVPVCRAEY